jgi:putrescine aminotransferase
MMKDSNFLKENNARFGWHPMAHPGGMRKNPPRIVVESDGVDVIDIDGHRMLDAVGGLWNVSLGHSAPAVKQAMIDQIGRMPYYNAFRGTTHDRLIELSVALTDFFAPEGMARAFFTSGGSDSVETALRLARQYHRLTGQPERTKVRLAEEGLSRHPHGRRLGQRQRQFPPGNYEPMLAGT